MHFDLFSTSEAQPINPPLIRKRDAERRRTTEQERTVAVGELHRISLFRLGLPLTPPTEPGTDDLGGRERGDMQHLQNEQRVHGFGQRDFHEVPALPYREDDQVAPPYHLDKSTQTHSPPADERAGKRSFFSCPPADSGAQKRRPPRSGTQSDRREKTPELFRYTPSEKRILLRGRESGLAGGAGNDVEKVVHLLGVVHAELGGTVGAQRGVEFESGVVIVIAVRVVRFLGAIVVVAAVVEGSEDGNSKDEPLS